MNEKQPILRERVIFLALLVLILAVLVYSPLFHEFIYPTGGDDTANHIQDLINLTANLDYAGRSITYYGITLLIPFTLLGFSAITVFTIFNYIVILSVFISMWILVRKFYGLASAILSFYVSVFVVLGTWYYFNDGTIFSIFNLWVVGILAIYGLCLWLKTGERKWLMITGLLFILTSLIHSASYLFIMASILLFTTVFSFYQFRKNNRIMLKRILFFGALFCISILTAWVTWMNALLPRLTDAMIGTITEGEVSYVPTVTPAHWTDHYLNIGIIFLLVLALLAFAIILKRGKREDRRDITTKLNQPLSYILLSFIVVLSVGAFTLLGYNYDRFARDLATFVGLSTAVLLGIAITYYRFKFKKILIVIVVSILITTNTPLHNWLEDYTALRPCDRQAIVFLNTVATKQIDVQHFSKLAPWIYELYTNENVNYVRAYDMKDYRETDYLIYRNNHMTFYTENRTQDDNIDINIDILSEQYFLIKFAQFQSGDNVVVIYKVIDS